ncbi:MAG: amidohydrolase family protein [Syntrophobacteraceae bacterium]
MRIDVHTHIFPPEIVRDRSPYFAEEPSFRLLYESPKSKLATAESLLEVMDRDGVDRSVVFGFPWNCTDLARRHNDYVMEAASKYAPRLIPMGCVNPLAPGSVAEADRCLHSGAKGLGELAIYGSTDSDAALGKFEELIDCCRSHQAILLVHANEPVGRSYPGKSPLGLDFYYSLCRLAAGIPLILAHWGGGLCFYELLRKDVPEVPAQVYYDTAASPFLYRSSVYFHMARMIGAGKILFGSDYPLISPRRYFREIASSGLTQEEIKDISGENARRLFSRSPDAGC